MFQYQIVCVNKLVKLDFFVLENLRDGLHDESSYFSFLMCLCGTKWDYKMSIEQCTIGLAAYKHSVYITLSALMRENNACNFELQG